MQGAGKKWLKDASGGGNRKEIVSCKGGRNDCGRRRRRNIEGEKSPGGGAEGVAMLEARGTSLLEGAVKK